MEAAGNRVPGPAAEACTILAEHFPLPAACQLTQVLLSAEEPTNAFPHGEAGAEGPASEAVPTEGLHWRDLVALRFGASVIERLYEKTDSWHPGDQTLVPPACGVPQTDPDQPPGADHGGPRGSTRLSAEQQAWLGGGGRAPGGPVLQGLAKILIRTRDPAADEALWRALGHLSPMCAS